MNEQGLFIGTVAVALYNGLFSPFTFIVLQWAPAWMPTCSNRCTAARLYDFASAIFIGTFAWLVDPSKLCGIHPPRLIGAPLTSISGVIPSSTAAV